MAATGPEDKNDVSVIRPHYYFFTDFWQTVTIVVNNFSVKLKHYFCSTASHLSLFVLEHFIDAGVEGRARKHGGDWISQVQDCFEN